MIRDLVYDFYSKIWIDRTLGPIFDRVLGDDWDPHVAKICDFWSSILLMSGRFRGALVTAHATIPDLGPSHFARWLYLFKQAAEQTCPPEAAALFVAKSQIIASGLQLGIAARRAERDTLRPEGSA